MGAEIKTMVDILIECQTELQRDDLPDEVREWDEGIKSMMETMLIEEGVKTITVEKPNEDGKLEETVIFRLDKRS